MIYLWNDNAELQLYYKDFTGYICENQIEISLDSRSAQMWCSMDTASTISITQQYSCFPERKETSMYKIITFTEHSHQHGMTGDKMSNLLERKS